MNYLKDLKWRYATKRMNGQEIPSEKLENILEATRLAPTSLGLQPFDVLVVRDATLRQNLSAAINNQPQVTEGSALLIFAAWKNIDAGQIDDYIRNISETRNIPVESLSDFRTAIERAVHSRTPAQVHQWAARQAYIALGYATAAASFEKVDSTPMEGFDGSALNDLLGLEEKGLSAIAVLALGYRDEAKDKLANAPKVRRPASSFFRILEVEPAA